MEWEIGIMLHGCDISKWQGADFDISEQDFVIAKATEGKTYVDTYFHHNIEKALKNNKLIGAYHYARPDNNSAKAEAEHFVNTIKAYVGKCLLALDWEGVALSFPVTWALEWLKEVERLTGVKPLLYCSASYIPECKLIADNGNGIWVAKWAEVAPDVKPTFSVMAIWQYTSKPYDKDKFLGDAKAWQKYCNSDIAFGVPEEGSSSCGCAFCVDFKEWLKTHGYTKK